jgi:hypothetical protein
LQTTAPDKRAFSLEWVAAGQPADMHLRLCDGRIWLLTPFGEWVTTGLRHSPSIAVTIRGKCYRVDHSLSIKRAHKFADGHIPKVERTTAGREYEAAIGRERDRCLPHANANRRCAPTFR